MTAAKALVAYDYLIVIFNVAPFIFVVPVKWAVVAFLPEYQKRGTTANSGLANSPAVLR